MNLQAAVDAVSEGISEAVSEGVREEYARSVVATLAELTEAMDSATSGLLGKPAADAGTAPMDLG